MTYLRATQSDLWTGPPAYEAAVPKSIARYIDRFSPGVVLEVESPTYMEAAVPDRIVQELDKVIANPIAVMRRSKPASTRQRVAAIGPAVE